MKLLLSAIPSLIIFLGSFLIALGSTEFLSMSFGGNFPFKLFPEYYVYLGLIAIVISLILGFLIGKKISSSSGWLMALLFHAVSLTLLLTLLISPLFHTFLMNYLFRFGYCTLITKSVEQNNYHDQTKKEEALKNLNQFCISANKLFNFGYP